MSKDRRSDPPTEPRDASEGIPLEDLADSPIAAALYELLFDATPSRKPERRRK